MASSASLTTTHLPHLREELEKWRKEQPPCTPFTTPLADIQAQDFTGQRGKDVIVAFRTRPPLPQEAENKFTAAVTEDDAEETTFCSGVTVASAEPGIFVAHVPGMKWSGPTLTHKKYASDVAFGPEIDNDEVYQRTVIVNDMIPLALASGTSCVLAYGQTGTGKTYTMEALEYRIARDLFLAAEKTGARLLAAERKVSPDSHPELQDGGGVFEFSVTFLELLGKGVVDLLDPADELLLDDQGRPVRKEVAVSEDKNGDVRPRVMSRTVESAEHLRELITSALSYRRVSATARNATSSRSHALLNIRIKNKLMPFAQDGQLILVDLAGSERYEDSKGHNKKRMVESRHNNNSLMQLKECVRAKAKMAQEDGFVHIPWRANKLTMLLKPVFDVEARTPSKTMIIAHVSPHIQDSVHSVNTLSYASPFKTAPPKPRGPAPYNPSDPRTWDHEQTVQWLTRQFTKAAKARLVQSHKAREKEAAQAGKKVRPLDPNALLKLAVDVDRLCPEGMTARNFGAMYSTEFVQRCLEAGNIGGDVTASVVKNIGGDIIAELTYMVLTAKTKLRKEIMKSRKVVSEEVYGESTWESCIPGTDIARPKPGTDAYERFNEYALDQYLATLQRNKALWDERLTWALINNRQSLSSKSKDEVGFDTVMHLMDELHSQDNSQGVAATSAS